MGAIGEAADIVGRQVNEWWGDWKYGDYLLEPKAAEAQAEARPTSKGCEAETKGKELTRAEKAAVYEALSKMAPVMTCNESNGLKSVGRINDLYEKDAAGKCVKTETMGIYFPATETLLLTDQAGDLQGIATTQEEEFKLTVIHEIAHGTFDWRDPRTCKTYESYFDNPLIKGYMDAVGWIDGSTLVEKPGNTRPTTYSGTSPIEDISEAFSLYLYFPEVLKAKSPARYEFLDSLYKGTNMEGLGTGSVKATASAGKGP